LFGATAPVVVTVIVVLPLAELLAGLKVAEAPEGSPVVPNVTAEENPPVIVSVTTEVPLAPAARLTVVGEADSEKLWIVSVIVLVCVRVPLVPVIVTV
jgi:hypothetical protein